MADTKTFRRERIKGLGNFPIKKNVDETKRRRQSFYIIKRLELESLYIMMNFKELSDNYMYYSFMEMIDETQSQLTFVPNDYLKGLDLLDIE